MICEDPSTRDRTHEKWAPHISASNHAGRSCGTGTARPSGYDGATRLSQSADRSTACQWYEARGCRSGSGIEHDQREQVVAAFCATWTRRLGGPIGAGPQIIDPIGENGTGGHTGRASAAGTPALEFAHNGSGGRHLGVERAAYLAPQRPQAPSAPDLQALERQAVRGEILGCHRSVPEPTGQSLGVVLR